MDDSLAPDYAAAALLTIDMQNDFVLHDAPFEVPGTLKIVPKVRDLVSLFRRHNRPIIHVVRLYLPDGSNVDLCRRAVIKSGRLAVIPNSQGADLVLGIKPSAGVKLDSERLLTGELQPIGPAEWVMYKPRWGAFFHTPLQHHLEDLTVNTVVVCGCNFPNCPRATVYEASERDYKVVFPVDAVSQVYERGLTELDKIGVILQSSSEIVKLMSCAN